MQFKRRQIVSYSTSEEIKVGVTLPVQELCTKYNGRDV